ncbi:MAG TPA: phosphotransferase family protein [Nocardioidaceae bacterium]|nr:phosphotransferase family protein [Nocardioidaceae bacterium]
MAEHDVTAETKMTVHQRDLADLGRRLAAWLEVPLKAEGQVQVSDVHAPSGGGMSSVTVLLHATWTSEGSEQEADLVARLAPDESSFPVFPSYDIRRQYDVMAGVAATSEVPVPRLVGIEESSDLLGAPFLVMHAVDGRAPTDNPPYVFGGWLYDATPEERRRLQDATVDVIAGIHAVPLEQFPSLRAEAGDDALRAHVQGQRDHYAWTHATDGIRVPILERTFDWLDQHWPADPGDTVLSWGDARPGNILYDGFDPAAVLDWEMAALAPRGVDVAWMALIHAFFQDIANVFELPGLPDFAVAEDVAARYAQTSGHEIQDLHWYLVYAALRHGVVMSQVKRRMIHFGEETAPEDPDDYVMHRALLERLLEGPAA